MGHYEGFDLREMRRRILISISRGNPDVLLISVEL